MDNTTGFSVKENDCIGFESQWKVKKIITNSAIQTTDYSMVEIETNTSITNEIETQTDSYQATPSNVDMDKLAEWLNNIYPKVAKEIDENNDNEVFKNYQPYLDEADANAKLIQTLNVGKEPSIGDNAALAVSALSWNSTGNTLAVSCMQTHRSWCHHTGVVKMYTFDRYEKFPAEPRLRLTTDTCVAALAFHPTLAYILAGGSYTGDVIVWNTQHGDGADAVFGKLSSHKDNVTKLAWITDANGPRTTTLLASSSLDGTLNVHNFNVTTDVFSVKLQYKIKPPVLARVRRDTELSEDMISKIDRGILCFDFSKHVIDMFVVGIEGGLVVQCSTLGAGSLKAINKDVPMFDPVFKYYEPQEGEVLDVAFSTSRRDMFLASGTDGEIRVFIIGEDEPAQVIFLLNALNNVCWVPHHEKLLWGCGNNGSIEIFNLVEGRKIMDVFELEFDRKPITQISLNQKRITTVAIGNTEGVLQLWNIPWTVL